MSSATYLHPPLQKPDQELNSLARTMMRVAQQLDEISHGEEAGRDSDIIPDHAKILSQYLRARRLREQLLPPSLFGEPAWDMLLDLYLSELRGRTVSITAACIASAVPATTALRWLARLGAEGLVARTGDPYDSRRAFVSLTPKAHEAMRLWIERSQLGLVAHGAGGSNEG